jgi:hypothetical protein
MVSKKNKNKNKILLYSIIGVLVIIVIVIIIFTVNNNSRKSKTNKSKSKEKKEPSENKDEVVSTGNVVCANNQYYDYDTSQCESKITAGSDCKNGVSCESGVCVLGSNGTGTCGENGLSKNCIEINPTDNNKCDACYNLKLNDKKQCCPLNCQDCDRDGNCKTCKDKHYLDNNECKLGESRSDLETDITAKNNTITEAKNECNNRSTPHIYSENPFKCLPCTNIPAYIQENVCKNYSDNNTCSNNQWSLWDSSTNEMKCYSEVPADSSWNQKTLMQAIANCVENDTYVHSTYGPVKYWKFSSQITDLSSVFNPKSYCSSNSDYSCNYVTWTSGAKRTGNYRGIQNKVRQWMQKADISGWDTSNVTNMEGMFKNLESLNNSDLRTKVINIGDRNYVAWDVSNVTSMKYIFNTWIPDKTKIDNWNILKALNTFSQAYYFGCPAEGCGSYKGRGTYDMFPHFYSNDDMVAALPIQKLVSNIPGKATYWAWFANSKLEDVKLSANPAVITMPPIS